MLCNAAVLHQSQSCCVGTLSCGAAPCMDVAGCRGNTLHSTIHSVEPKQAFFARLPQGGRLRCPRTPLDCSWWAASCTDTCSYAFVPSLQSGIFKRRTNVQATMWASGTLTRHACFAAPLRSLGCSNPDGYHPASSRVQIYAAGCVTDACCTLSHYSSSWQQALVHMPH